MRSQNLLPSVFAVLATVAALLALTGYQVTTRTAATRFLYRITAAMIEVDRWLPAHLEDLKLLARDRPDGVMRVGDVPVPVTLSSSLVADGDEASVRGLLLGAMSSSLYEDGNDAFRDDDGNPRTPSITERVYWAVRLLSRDTHSLWKAALPLSLLILLALLAAVLYTGRNPAVLIAMGGVLAGLAAGAAWLLAQVASNAVGSPVSQELALVVRDGAWLGLRNSFAVAAVAGGLAFLVRSAATPAGSMRSGRMERPPEFPLG